MKTEQASSMQVSQKSASSENTYTIITCHFGETAWVEMCANQIDKHSDSTVREIIIVNQNRTETPSLKKLPRVNSVVEFDEYRPQFEAIGHDHPHSLDLALRMRRFETSHIVVLDSDCFPVSDNWLMLGPGSHLAADPTKHGLTHPCFMVLAVDQIKSVNFSDSISELGFDTGRLVGLQLSKAGHTPEIFIPQKAFCGFKGDFYNEGSVFHFGSGSFAFSSDSRLTNQVIKIYEQFFLKKIKKLDFSLSRFEQFLLALAAAYNRFRNSFYK